MQVVIIVLLGLLFLLIFYILLRFLFKKKTSKYKSLIIIALSVSAYVLMNILIYYNSDLFFNQNQKFESELWLENKSIRGDMVTNLLESEILLKKNDKEVKNLIGEPDLNDNMKWVYNILSHDEFNFIEYQLTLHFEDNKCKNVEIKKVIVE